MKTLCVNGHPRVPTNIRGNGGCRVCHNERETVRRLEMGQKPRMRVDGFCSKGHPLTPDNIRTKGKYSGCLTCHRESALRSARSKGVSRRLMPHERTHCPQGHLLTPETVRSGRHEGECRICHRLRESNMRKPEIVEYAAVLAFDPCSYCGGPGGVFDHIIPRAKGGVDEADNLTSACFSCNSQKRTKSLLRFLCERA